MSNRKYNMALHTATSKYGLENFNFCIYEYFTYESKTTSFKLLTYLETMYINKFKFSNLYNFLKNASSSEGYKHTYAAKPKRVERFKDKTNHPFWGKHHDAKSKSLISKPGLLNPVFGKTHSEKLKTLWEVKKLNILTV